MFKNFLAKDKINTGRQMEIDMAKALAIIWMVVVHVAERYYQDVSFSPGLETWINNFIEFVGGPLSAPVFMTAMGIGLAYSKDHSPAGNGKRGLGLLGKAYVLNFLRFPLPCLLLYCFTREHILLELSFQAMYILDILHFAALVFLFFALVRLFNIRDAYVAGLTLLLLVVGGLLPPLYPEPSLWASLPGYFIFQNQFTTFPFFHWLAYPVAGYLFAKLLQRVSNKKIFYRALLMASLLLLALFSAILLVCGYDLAGIFLGPLYYRQDPIKFTWIILICFAWFSLLYFISLALVDGHLKNLIIYMSKKLNDIYMMQWILIGWTIILFIHEIPVYGYEFPLLCLAIIAGSVALIPIKEKLFAKLKAVFK